MIWNPFKVFTKKSVGIDIGTSSIKIVELSSVRNRIKLENYGEIKTEAISKKPFRTLGRTIFTISSQDVSQAILAVLKATEIKEKEVYFSIPDFSSFFTWFDLPPLTKKEINQAVRFEARQHIPLPIAEVILDWRIIQGKLSDKEKIPLKILLVAVPKEIINQYQEIANLAQLRLRALEAEVFALTRALIREEERGSYLVMDIGAQTTTISVIDNKKLKRSHSFDISGNELTERIAKGLDVDYKQAQQLKKKYGLKQGKTREILLPLIDLILREGEKISQNFYRQELKKIQKIIIAGGSAFLPGLTQYFSEKFPVQQIEIANPFSNIFYPPPLEETLKELGPSYAIAVGMALRGLK